MINLILGILIGFTLGIITVTNRIKNYEQKLNTIEEKYKKKIINSLYELDTNQKTLKQTTAKYKQIDYAKEQLEKLL